MESLPQNIFPQQQRVKLKNGRQSPKYQAINF